MMFRISDVSRSLCILARTLDIKLLKEIYMQEPRNFRKLAAKDPNKDPRPKCVTKLHLNE